MTITTLPRSVGSEHLQELEKIEVLHPNGDKVCLTWSRAPVTFCSGVSSDRAPRVAALLERAAGLASGRDSTRRDVPCEVSADDGSVPPVLQGTLVFHTRQPDLTYSLSLRLHGASTVVAHEGLWGTLASWENAKEAGRQLLYSPVRSTVVRHPDVAAEYSRGKRGQYPHLPVHPGELALAALRSTAWSSREHAGGMVEVDPDLMELADVQLQQVAAIEVVRLGDRPDLTAVEAANLTFQNSNGVVRAALENYVAPTPAYAWPGSPGWTERDKPYVFTLPLLVAASLAPAGGAGRPLPRLVVLDDETGQLRVDHLEGLADTVRRLAGDPHAGSLRVVVCTTPALIEEIRGAAWSHVPKQAAAGRPALGA